MTHDQPATGVDEETVLYCPACAYNLTGLIENRCPECGQHFDPEQLRLAAEQDREEEYGIPREPISTGAAVAWLGVHLGTVWLLITVLVVGDAMGIEHSCLAFPLLLVGGTVTAVITTWRLFSRLAMARAIRAGDAASWTNKFRALRVWHTVTLFVLLSMQWIVPACLLLVYMKSL